MKLTNLRQGLDSVNAELNQARSNNVNIEDMLAKRFDEAGKRLEGSLKNIIKEQGQDAVFSSAVHQTVLSVSQNNQLLLQGLAKDFRALSGELSANDKELMRQLDKTIEISSKSMAGGIEKQLLAIGLQVDGLPKQFPIPKDTDLSGLSSGIKELKSSISSIKFPEIPKTVDITPQLKAMEERMGKRVVEFEVIRGMNGLIEKIVVTEGDI